jgi:hypothetical protein
MVKNLGFTNACRTMNNIHKDRDQSNKQPIPNKQTKNTFTVFPSKYLWLT